MNESTQTAVTGEGNPRMTMREFFSQPDIIRLQGIQKSNPFGSAAHNKATVEIERLIAIAKAEPKGEQCTICGKDSWTCEHFDPREEALNNQ